MYVICIYAKFWKRNTGLTQLIVVSEKIKFYYLKKKNNTKIKCRTIIGIMQFTKHNVQSVNTGFFFVFNKRWNSCKCYPANNPIQQQSQSSDSGKKNFILYCSLCLMQ